MALSVSIDLVSSSARVTSVKSAQRLVLTSRPKDRTPGLPGSDKNHDKNFTIPTIIAWQIDPFGHSKEQVVLCNDHNHDYCDNTDHSLSSKSSSQLWLKARLFAEMGFEGLFFARIDYKDKVQGLIRMLMIKI